MAIMIPSFPYNFKPESLEDEMFFSLERLPDSYYIFYSFVLAGLKDGTWKEKEVDFVIYNRSKGIMFVEAKAGKVWCDRGVWRYGNGKEMKDPFKQADTGRWVLDNNLRDMQRYSDSPIADRCKMPLAVWFPSITRSGLDNIELPQNADRNVIMTGEDVADPRGSIERIFSYDILNGNIQTDLSEEDHHFLLNSFLCPTFKILPSKALELDYKRKRFDAMIAEQSNILNYLEYQRSAVINGAAGTGKTMIAVEKARRHSQAGETVLFLCFNSKLREHLEREYPYKGVSYYTIDGFACKMCSTPEADFEYLEEVLLRYYDEPDSFPYQHIIVDEGQDFGQGRMHTDVLFEMMEDIVLKTENGTFYVFYDKLQMIQSFSLPKFIENADCRLTLYKNCRNTRRIAETSFKPLRQSKPPKLFDSALAGDIPVMVCCDEKETSSALDEIIERSVEDMIENIQIVSCASEGKSTLSNRVSNEHYVKTGRSIPFTTVRKFKGLEADHVILVDVNKELIMNNSMLFYVGSSRAKFQLTVIADLDDDECTELIGYFGSVVKRRDPKGTLAKLLGCKLIDRDKSG